MAYIRDAAGGDLSAIQCIANNAYAPFVTRMGRKPAPMVADFAALIARGAVSVLLEDGCVIGFVVFYPYGGAMHLENVAVSPSHHGYGFGRQLIDHVEQMARWQKLHAIELYTNEKMTENLQYYSHLGYVETHRAVQEGFHRVFFRKSL